MKRIKCKPSNQLPIGGNIIVTAKDEYLFDFLHLFISDLHLLRYSLIDRLCQLKLIIHEQKNNLTNFFLQDDIEILKKLNITKLNFDMQRFIMLIINNNEVKFTDQPSKKIDKLVTEIQLQKIDRESHEYLTKWMTLDKNKLDGLKNNKIYAGFPSGFNDVFDSQLRCDESTKMYLSNKFLSGTHVDGDPDPVPIEERRLRFIEFYQEQLNNATICCFSFLDPLKTASNHMWGLYANCGKGIAIKYKIDDILKYFFDKSEKIKREFGRSASSTLAELDYCRMMPVKYQGAYNKLDFFEQYITWILKKTFNPKEHGDFIFDYLRTKTNEWLNEQEVRLISLKFVSCKPSNQQTDVFFNEDKATLMQRLNEEKSSFDKTIEFVPLDGIIFGWNYKNNNVEDQKLYGELLEWLKENSNIQIQFLRPDINYLNNEFVNGRTEK